MIARDSVLDSLPAIKSPSESHLSLIQLTSESGHFFEPRITRQSFEVAVEWFMFSKDAL
jgi:hypothetical protein